MKIRYVLGLLFVLVVPVAAPVHAQQWPERSVHIVVPFPPAGVPDILARIVSERLKERLGQTFLVENKGGAAGNIGADAVAKAAPDGYTFLVGSSGTHAIHATLYKSLPFDPIKDFDAVTLLATVPNVLVVTNKFPAKSLDEFVAYARATPGKINYGSIGNGSSQHLAGTQFETATGVKMMHIPYKAVPQVVADLMSGQIDAMFQLVPNIARQVKDGQVRAIAVTTKSRSAALPGVPTMAEAGLKGFDTAGWFGLLAPKGTPKPIINRMSQEVGAVMALPEIQDRVTKYGAEPNTMNPSEFSAFIVSETDRWRSIVRASGARID